MDNRKIKEVAGSLIQKIPDQEKLTLIGGQALFIWYEFYYRKYREFYSDDWLVGSADIDFKGGQKAVKECAKAWGGEARLSNIDDHTPNSGVVIIDIEGERLSVDFLWSVIGLSNGQVEAERLKFALPVNDKMDSAFYVLSPFLCLVSRVFNICSLHRTDKHSVDQLRTAVVIVKCDMLEKLESKDEELARELAEKVFKLASSPEGLRVFIEHEVAVFEAIPDDERFYSEFRGKRYPQMRKIMKTKLSSKINQLKDSTDNRD